MNEYEPGSDPVAVFVKTPIVLPSAVLGVLVPAVAHPEGGAIAVVVLPYEATMATRRFPETILAGAVMESGVVAEVAPDPLT